MLSGYVLAKSMSLCEKIDISRCIISERIMSPNKIQSLTGVGFGGIEGIMYIACGALTATTGCRT